MEAETVENTTTYLEEQQAAEDAEAKAADASTDESQENQTLEDKGQEEIDEKENQESQESDKKGEKEDKTPKWMKRELYKEREARRQLQEKIDRLERGTQQQTPQEDPRPNPDNYEEISKYHEDLGRWAARDEARKERERSAQREQETRQTQDYDNTRAEFERLADKIRDQHEDFDEKMQDLAWTLRERYNPQIAQGFMSCVMSAGTPAAAYDIADKPAEIDKIVQLGNTLRVTARLGAIEHRLTANKPEKKKSAAPSPRKGVESSGVSNSKEPDPSDTERWLQWRSAQLKKRGGHY